MKKVYRYKWKNFVSSPDSKTVRFNKPLEKGMVLIDLRDGCAYEVLAVSKVADPDPIMSDPKEMVQTWAAQSVSAAQLTNLRIKYRFEEGRREYAIVPFRHVA
jgi:hypothetical protein